ncbi:tail tape measure protein TP901 core region protein, partial [Brevibacillus agri BAB-2500]
MSSMATAVFEKVKSISSLITEGIKDFLGIHSPSRVMMEVGFFTGEGLAQGIEGTQARVSQASADLADDVTAPHNTPAAKLPPATAAATPGAAGGTMRMEIALSLHVTGDADPKKVGASVAENLKPTLQEIIESAARRLGVSLVVE